MARKGNRVQVILECTEQKGTNIPGMSRYITTKNKKNTPERVELKKYNPYMRKITLHKEIKYGKKGSSNAKKRRWRRNSKSN